MVKDKKSKEREFCFEPAMERLEQIVRELESGEQTLEQSIGSFEEGIRISRQCRDYLEQARQRVEILMGLDDQGRPLLDTYVEDVDDEDEEDGR